MPLLEVRTFSETLLRLDSTASDLQTWNHVLEPEYHQARYVDACSNAAAVKGSFQLSDPTIVVRQPSRGCQPSYADSEDDLESLSFAGMIDSSGKELADKYKALNVCALKSISIRVGYVDFSVARSVTRAFYLGRGKRACVKQDDLLINSTGDGTIGRVAVYNQKFPAVVDGHITIVRFRNPELSWYVAAYLLTKQGQDQIYRFINGSSGQVEIYPQDIARLWVPGCSPSKQKLVIEAFKQASTKHREFYKNLRTALNYLE